MSASFGIVPARALNRVLRDYPLAMQRLARHAGKRADFTSGVVRLRLRVTGDGAVEPVGEGFEASADVAFEFAPADWPLLQKDRGAALGRVRFTGDSEFAQLIGELARELKWDAEADLSALIGDVAAHRVARGVRRALQWQSAARERLHDNLAEYLAEETGAFMRAGELEALTRAYETLRDDCARLEARIALLQDHFQPPPIHP